MIFNDRRSTRIKSAKERQRVHNLVKESGEYISSPEGKGGGGRRKGGEASDQPMREAGVEGRGWTHG